MLKVAICDDETSIGSELERVLLDIFGKLRIRHEIDVFFAGDRLCRKMEKGEHYDIIFLDIQFANSEISGVDVGRLIRDTYQNNRTSIVYISWEKNYAMQLFETRPLHFLLKPLAYEEVEKTVKTHLKITEFSSGEFTYKKSHDIFKVWIKDIVYLANCERKVIIHLACGREEAFYGSLKEVYNKQLKEYDFLFIHASFVVNYDYISTIKYSQVFVANNKISLPISPNRRAEIRELYLTIMTRRR